MFDLSKFKRKRVALIGGAGFIGHNLALKLKEVGALTASQSHRLLFK